MEAAKRVYPVVKTFKLQQQPEQQDILSDVTAAFYLGDNQEISN